MSSLHHCHLGAIAATTQWGGEGMTRERPRQDGEGGDGRGPDEGGGGVYMVPGVLYMHTAPRVHEGGEGRRLSDLEDGLGSLD